MGISLLRLCAHQGDFNIVFCNSRYLRTKLATHKKYPRGTGGSTPMDLKLTEYEEELLLVVGEEVMTGLEGAHLSTDRVGKLQKERHSLFYTRTGIWRTCTASS